MSFNVMAYLKTLPLLEGAKFLVIDEGLDACYARKLVAGWLKMWNDRGLSKSVELLSFSDPKSVYRGESELFTLSNINIRDCYTLDINEVKESDFDNLQQILKAINMKSTVIIDCLSSLIIYVGLAKALQFLDKLSRQVPQLICLYRRDFNQSKVPCIETVGTTYIKLDNHNGICAGNNLTYTVKIIHRKVGGGVIIQNELVNQSNESYEIQSEKIEKKNIAKIDAGYDTPKKIESSFRIEINDTEMQQREKTALPYTNVTNTSKILYQPDDVDDIDEEDPDDDLCI